MDSLAPLLLIPGPVTCAPEVLAAMAGPTVDHRGPEFAAVLGRIVDGLRPVFGTEHEVLMLGCSGTGGLEAAVASAFSPGDRVLACPVGAFGQRLATIARGYGLEVETIDTPLGHALDPAFLAARLRGSTAQTFAGILLTHNETSTGVQNDMAALATAIGEHPATVVVDSVSGLGATAFAMDAWHFDIVVTASQKALAVPPGLAMVAVSPRAWERIERARAPRLYLDLQRARTFARQGQTPWTPPVSIAYALAVALGRYHARGAASAYERHDRYARAIRAFAAAAGLEVFSQPGAHSVTVVALRVPVGIDASRLRRTLRERDAVTIGGGQGDLAGKIVRIGTMGEVSAGDLLRALTAFGTASSAQGFAITERSVAAAAAVLDEALVAPT